MQLVTLSLQMPQVMDSSSQGIDLHFWGEALKGTSEKIQVVSAPQSPSFLSSPSCCPPPLLSSSLRPCRIRGTSIFSPAGNSPLPLLPVWESLTEEEAEWCLQQCGVYMSVLTACMCTEQVLICPYDSVTWYMCVCVCVCLWICIFVCVSNGVCMNIWICVFVTLFVHIYV